MTIPKRIRDFLKVKTGDRLDFVIGEDGQVLLRPRTAGVDELKGLLHRSRSDSTPLSPRPRRFLRLRHRLAPPPGGVRVMSCTVPASSVHEPIPASPQSLELNLHEMEAPPADWTITGAPAKARDWGGGKCLEYVTPFNSMTNRRAGLPAGNSVTYAFDRKTVDRLVALQPAINDAKTNAKVRRTAVASLPRLDCTRERTLPATS